MSVWSDLPDETLFKILYCQKIKKVFKILKAVLDYDKQELIRQIRNSYKPELTKHHIPTSLFAALTSEAGYSISMLLALLEAASLIGAALTAIFTGVLVGIGVIASALFFIGTYRKIRKDNNKYIEFFDLLQVKQECLNVLQARHPEMKLPAKQPEPALAMAPVNPKKEFKFKNKDIFSKLLGSLGCAFLASGILFCTYYICTATIIAGIGAMAIATAMSGGIGFFVALGVAALIGIGFGVFYYYKKQSEDKRAQYTLFFNKQIDKQIRQCEKVREKTVGVNIHERLLTRSSTEPDLLRDCRENQNKSSSGFRVGFQFRGAMGNRPITQQPPAVNKIGSIIFGNK